MRQALTVKDLRGERAKANVNLTDLAAALGMNRNTLGDILRGDSGQSVDPDFARRYMAALKVAPATRYMRRSTETAK